jgi:hypothetical protein
MDHLLDPAGHGVGRTRDHLTGVAVAHQHDAIQLLGRDESDHVVDVCAQRDARMTKMGSFAIAGERDGVHLVARTAQAWQHMAPDPRATPSPMHQDDLTNAFSLEGSMRIQ